MRRFPVASGIIVVLSFAAFAGEKDSQKVDIPEKATVRGNYSQLVKIIEVPEDEVTYGKFYDFGYYAGTQYAGYTDLPEGYWVYVAPKWYIWGKSEKLLAGNSDPFAGLIGKSIVVGFPGSSVTKSGKVTENSYYYLLLSQKESNCKLLVNKSQVAYVEWK